MVQVNLIDHGSLADQHLIAEYNEIFMLVPYIRKFPVCKDTPKNYVLGTGHMTFFKDKVLYLKKKHESLKSKMKASGFFPIKTIFKK